MTVATTIPNGGNPAHEDLVDARNHAVAFRDIANGAPVFPEADMDAYLAAPSPLACWRKRRGKTQAALAAEAGVSQPSLANLEPGNRDASVAVLARIAAALDVRIDDLVG